MAAEDSFAKACQLASKWNAQLNEVRQARGAQWDYATRMYHAPKESDEYYSNVTPSKPEAAQSDAQHQAQQQQQQQQQMAHAAAKKNNPNAEDHHESGRPRRRGAASRSYAEETIY